MPSRNRSGQSTSGNTHRFVVDLRRTGEVGLSLGVLKFVYRLLNQQDTTQLGIVQQLFDPRNAGNITEILRRRMRQEAQVRAIRERIGRVPEPLVYVTSRFAQQAPPVVQQAPPMVDNTTAPEESQQWVGIDVKISHHIFYIVELRNMIKYVWSSIYAITRGK